MGRKKLVNSKNERKKLVNSKKTQSFYDTHTHTHTKKLKQNECITESLDKLDHFSHIHIIFIMYVSILQSHARYINLKYVYNIITNDKKSMRL